MPRDGKYNRRWWVLVWVWVWVWICLGVRTIVCMYFVLWCCHYPDVTQQIETLRCYYFVFMLLLLKFLSALLSQTFQYSFAIFHLIWFRLFISLYACVHINQILIEFASLSPSLRSCVCIYVALLHISMKFLSICYEATRKKNPDVLHARGIKHWMFRFCS